MKVRKMNLAIGTLISSLDNIVKNKNASERKDKSMLSDTSPLSQPTVFSSSIQAKYQVLQSKLSKLQNELTREQANLRIIYTFFTFFLQKIIFYLTK